MYIAFKILTGEEKETSRQQLGPFTRKLQRNNKNPTNFVIWRVKNLHAQNLTTMEEFD